jgi:Tfp pilus assembly PilM family ATPase
LARFLALDWDHQQLHIVAATVNRGVVRIERAAVFPEPQTPNLAEAEALGRRLRERLKEAGIAPAPVLACVGRDRVILKDVRHPPVSAAEEPGLVRFQTVKELTEAADEVVIDYTAGGLSGNGVERRAVVLVIRRELLQAYQALCQAAGLKLAALTPRVFGIAACVQHLTGTAEDGNGSVGAVAVLTRAEQWAEFCVLRAGVLCFARSAAPGNTLPGEIRRNLAVHAGQSPQHPVEAVYVAGTNDQIELRDRLQEMLGLPVHSLDPFARTTQPEVPATGRGAFAGPVGLLYAQAVGSLPINFVNIKQPVAARDPAKRRLLVGAAVAAVLLLGLSGWCYSQLADHDRELNELSLQNADLDRQLSAIEVDAAHLKAIGEWTDGEIVWLDELYDLTERFPSTPNLRLTELIGIPLSRTGKDKHIANLTLGGIATEDAVALTLNTRLNEDSRYYRVPYPDLTNNNTGGPGPLQQFRRKFTQKMDIERRPPVEYKLDLTIPSDTKKADSGNWGGLP